jgi:hypothetical protein
MNNVFHKILAVLFLVLMLFSIRSEGDDKGSLWKDRITSKDLGGESRYMNYLSLDKPIYRVGETVYMRAVVLTDNNLPVNKTGRANFKIKDSKDREVFKGYGRIENSVIGCSWEIPKGSAGGKYTALISGNSLGCPEYKRTFEVRTYRVPRLKTQIEFLKKAYGPGEKVQAELEVSRAEGGVPDGAKITVTAILDGKNIYNKCNFRVDTKGLCSVEFNLPNQISVGDGTLSFIISDGGVKEIASKTIPIAVKTPEITFYPEGGYLISGLENRVYIEATNKNGEPADISGKIFILKNGLKSGSSVSEVKTLHEGRGVFEFKPEAGIEYALIVDKPVGIVKKFILPEIKAEGAVIKSEKKVYDFNEKITISVSFTKGNVPKKIILSKREKELDSQAIDSNLNKQVISLDPKDAEGVLIVTLISENSYPIAERLVFRRPKFNLNISLKTDKKTYKPGDTVHLEILTTNESGTAVEGLVGLTVTDDASLSLCDKRFVQPRLPEMVYLESEVLNFKDATAFRKDNKRAGESIDLLLGTQGWRRFILVEYKEIKEKFKYNAMLVLAEKIQKFPRKLFKHARNGMVENLEMEDDLVFEAMPRLMVLAEDKKQKVEAPANAGNMEMPQKIREKMLNVLPVIRKKRIARLKVIREYAHKKAINTKSNERSDFTETVYWNAGIKTNPRSGKAEVSFDLSDNITSFRVLADGFARNAALGSSDILIKSLEPFYLEPKMPLCVSVGDEVKLPIALVNSTEKNFDKLRMIVRCDGLDFTPKVLDAVLPSKKRIRKYITIKPNKSGLYSMEFTASANGFTDTIKRNLLVKPKGFPVKIQQAGLISSKAKGVCVFSIPEQAEIDSIKTYAKVFPSPLANIQEALNALLRRPHGCFEQTSSTNYPVVMARQYIDSHTGISMELIKKTDSLLEEGYKKLVSFECDKKGYEWFGKDPGHEALTAYGLMQFTDMSKVMPVDKKMLSRTKEWLLKRRDGNGGFKLNKRALDSFGRAPVLMTNAYIVWSLLESGEDYKKLEKEINGVKLAAEKSKDSYQIALASNILFMSKDKKGAMFFASKLADKLNKEGCVAGGVTTITNSGGNSLGIETTSLAIMAWLKADGFFADKVEQAMKWLFEKCKSGSFGSTQSTILALKAINAYDKSRSKPEEPGSVQLIVDGQKFGNEVSFDKETQNAIELPDFSSSLTKGKHKVEILMNDGSKMPYSIEMRYNTLMPADADKSPLSIQTKLSSDKIQEGMPLDLKVTVNTIEKDISTPVAIIGIPGGCELRYEQLEELKNAGRIDSYETFDGMLVLYWRKLAADTKITLPISLNAVIPGKYTASASCVYPYYTEEQKVWTAGTSITIE